MPAHKSPKAPIRLTPAFFQILLSVANQPKHGYAIMREVHERTGGAVKLGPGSLYWAIKRLVTAKLLAETDGGPQPDDRTRRVYELTAEGRTVLKHETQVLSDIVGYAVSQKIIAPPKATP